MPRRMDRINGLLQQEISRILKFDLRDPRVSEIISVTHVDVTADLSRAKVFISILGNEIEKRNSLLVLKSASGFIHKSMRSNLILRTVPSINFVLDESIEQSESMVQLISENRIIEEPHQQTKPPKCETNI